MKRNTSFAKTIISNYEGTPMIQKMELKRQKKNFSISQAINEYNLNRSRQRQSIHTKHHNSSSNILNVSNYNTNERKNNLGNSNMNTAYKTGRKKPPIPPVGNIPFQKPKQQQKTFDSKIITTGENIPLNLLEIFSNENDKAFLFKFTKFNNDVNIDSILLKLGTIRFNLFSQYMSTCLNIISDYKTILNQPIIKSIQKFENGIMIQKQLFNMKLYIYDFIQKLPDNKKNEQIKEYFKFLLKEIEMAKKLGLDSDSYEINYLFNFFPKGIEIMFDYDMFECVYYNSKKNNKISGKALLPPPEFCFKLDTNRIEVKLFDFEIEIEDLEDVKHIMSQLLKIIQDKIKVVKLFIEPCIAQGRRELEAKEKENSNNNTSKKVSDKKIPVEKYKNKNNIFSVNTNSNSSEQTTQNINEINSNTANNMNIINKKNYTYTNLNSNNNIIKNIENHINLIKRKNKKENENKNINSENEDKKTNNLNEDENEIKNVLNDLDDDKSQLTEYKNDFFRDDNSGSMNLSEDLDEKKNFVKI